MRDSGFGSGAARESHARIISSREPLPRKTVKSLPQSEALCLQSASGQVTLPRVLIENQDVSDGDGVCDNSKAADSPRRSDHLGGRGRSVRTGPASIAGRPRLLAYLT